MAEKKLHTTNKNKIQQMKTILLLFAYICCTSAQNFRGKVTDEAGIPIPYANIVLLQAADSSFVTGTISNQQGDFTLQTNADDQARLLKSEFYRLPHADNYCKPRILQGYPNEE